MSSIQEWLIASLFSLGIIIILLGIALVISPKKIKRISQPLDRWISTEAFFKIFDKTYFVERIFYHHHRLLGLLIMLGALYVIYSFAFSIDVDASISWLPVIKHPVISSWIYDSLFYVLIGMNTIIVIFGALIFIRPSLLKSIEMYSNRWITSDKALQQLNRSHDIPEEIFHRNIRLFGVAVILAGIYIMMSTGTMLF